MATDSGTFILEKNVYPELGVVPARRTKGGAAHAMATKGVATATDGATVPAGIEGTHYINYRTRLDRALGEDIISSSQLLPPMTKPSCSDTTRLV